MRSLPVKFGLAFASSVGTDSKSAIEIAVKAEANRPKDRIMLPILIALLEERDGS